jgi:phenylacetate-coenzyme A ligase PaaK-like adenylate-forming protein
MSFLQRQAQVAPPAVVSEHLGPGRNMVDLWSPARLEAYQRDALADVIGQAFARNDFYRERFRAADVSPATLRLPRDLGRLPLLQKDDLRGRPWLLLTVERDQLSQINMSTGTTGGQEIYVPQTWEDLNVRGLEPTLKTLVPVGPEDVVLNALPYDMSSAGLAFHRTFQRGRGAIVVPAGKGGVYSTPESAVGLLRDLGATVLLTGPSYSVLMSEAGARLGIDLPALPLRFMWLTGEGCSPAFRARIEATWGCPAYFYYGSLEAGPLGVECAHKCGYHIAAGHVHVEIVDPGTGAVVPLGTAGHVVVTSLTRVGAPLIRYDTQDLATLDDAPCACGVSIPRLRLLGRAVDQLRIAERSYSPYHVEELLMRIVEVGPWYELVPSAERLHVRVETAPGVAPSPAVRDLIKSRLETGLSVPVSVELAAIKRSGGKVERVKRG